MSKNIHQMPVTYGKDTIEEGDLREDARSRGEKVNEKVLYIYIYISIASTTRLEKPCVLLKFLGLRSRIYENLLNPEMSII